MGTKQRHRGQHPKDAHLFLEKFHADLRAATADLCWLLSRGYTENASLKLVGDRFQLRERQRMAVLRSVATQAQVASRQAKEISSEEVKGQILLVDGYNLLITTETLLSGGFLFRGLDGCYRDIASVHGTYKRVEETHPAIQLIGESLHRLKPAKVRWFLDAPVSNSGRLKGFLYEAATEAGWNWEVEVVRNPDENVSQEAGVAVSSDSWVLDESERWFNAVDYIIGEYSGPAEVLNLRTEGT